MITMLIAALLALQPAASPVGQRTQTPESLLAGMGLAPDQDDLAAAVAAAAVHPLGSLANPVRVGGPDGQRAYLARLRCGDGSAPRVGQRGSMGEGAFGTIVDGNPLDCGTAAPGRTTLVMDIYHEEHRETRAPAGLTLVAE